jgi:hypothetical protein
MIPLFGDYYIGADHSRLMTPTPDPIHPIKSYHFTHIVILNVRQWKVVHVTRPLLYFYNGAGDENPYCIQDPVSINKLPANYKYNGTQLGGSQKEQSYLITVNIADTYSFLYEVEVSVTEDQVAQWNQLNRPTGICG